MFKLISMKHKCEGNDFMRWRMKCWRDHYTRRHRAGLSVSLKLPGLLRWREEFATFQTSGKIFIRQSRHKIDRTLAFLHLLSVHSRRSSLLLLLLLSCLWGGLLLRRGQRSAGGASEGRRPAERQQVAQCAGRAQRQGGLATSGRFPSHHAGGSGWRTRPAAAQQPAVHR